MDTRSKNPDCRRRRALAGPLTVVTGYFDVLRAEHARELEAIRSRSGAPDAAGTGAAFPGEVFDIHARARMVAALRVVDYVLIADELEPDALLEALRPQT